MKVHQLIEWLQKFPDQDAIVQVVKHHDDTNDYYMQGGYVTTEDFDPDSYLFEYVNFRGNKWVSKDASYYNKSFLLLGVTDG